MGSITAIKGFVLNVLPVVLIALQTAVQIVSGELDYTCPLEWVAEGFGNVPVMAISPSPGEYVARVKLQESKEWCLGRLVPLEGTAQVPFFVESGDHTVLESETYEVLTNPGNCVLNWEPAFGGNFPTYAVPGDGTQLTPVEFVARSEVAGFSMAGPLVPADSAAFIPYEGQVYQRRHYEVLTSTFPRMRMRITDFTFPSLDFRVLDSKSHDVLVGQMELLNDISASGGNNGGSSAAYPISHSKDVKEVFRFEEKFGWHGIGNISLEMDLWVGSPSVETSFFLERDMEPFPTLEFGRIRQIVVERTVTLSEGSAFSGGEMSQVCSSIRVLKDFGVKWTAVGEAIAEDMKGSQVKEILLRSGRNIIEVDEWTDVVRVRLHGTLRGTFVLGSMATYTPRDANGACSSILTNNWRKHSHWLNK